MSNDYQPGLKHKTCPSCGNPLECGSESNTGCWCSSLPPILPLYPNNGCLCSSCLKQKIKEEIVNYVEDVRAGKRENIAPNYANAPQQEGIDYYLENGFLVFTGWYHLKRGTCCGNGCRHCPYQPKKK